MSSESPRRFCVDRMTPAELAIRDAMLAVEALPPDLRLTEAVVLLERARTKVADFVDGVHTTDAGPGVLEVQGLMIRAAEDAARAGRR